MSLILTILSKSCSNLIKYLYSPTNFSLILRSCRIFNLKYLHKIHFIFIVIKIHTTIDYFYHTHLTFILKVYFNPCIIICLDIPQFLQYVIQSLSTKSIRLLMAASV